MLAALGDANKCSLKAYWQIPGPGEEARRAVAEGVTLRLFLRRIEPKETAKWLYVQDSPQPRCSVS